jgi:hypothetical protein
LERSRLKHCILSNKTPDQTLVGTYQQKVTQIYSQKWFIQ